MMITVQQYLPRHWGRVLFYHTGLIQSVIREHGRVWSEPVFKNDAKQERPVAIGGVSTIDTRKLA